MRKAQINGNCPLVIAKILFVFTKLQGQNLVRIRVKAQYNPLISESLPVPQIGADAFLKLLERINEYSQAIFSRMQDLPQNNDFNGEVINPPITIKTISMPKTTQKSTFSLVYLFCLNQFRLSIAVLSIIIFITVVQILETVQTTNFCN